MRLEELENANAFERTHVTPADIKILRDMEAKRIKDLKKLTKPS